MTDQKAWAVGKKFDRIRRYRKRMEADARDVNPKQWLAAVRRDDATDPEPRDRAPEQRQSSQEAR